MDDRPRKDRLIQTRVPQDLESTLKDEARKRRLSVSHLIRNVLEDTFSLVDNVVTEVDRVVTDSVGMAQTLKRDAQRLAATARGHTSHREPRNGHVRVSSAGPQEPLDVNVDEPMSAAIDDAISEAVAELSDATADREAADEAMEEVTQRPDDAPSAAFATAAAAGGAAQVAGGTATSKQETVGAAGLSALADVYGFQELVLNRAASCAKCGSVIPRGSRAYLGMTDKPGLARVWVCQDCLDTISE